MRVVIIILACVMAACSSSNGSDSASSTNVGSDEFRRDRNERAIPEMVQEDWTHDYQPVSLNTEVRGSLLERSSAYVSFRLSEDQVVAVTVDGTVRDLDLRVWDELGNIDYAHRTLRTDEGFLVYARANVAYFVEVTAEQGSGDFALKVMEPHRSAFSLSEEEVYVMAEGDGSEYCLTNGGNRQAWTIDGWQYQYIYNVRTRSVRLQNYALPHTTTDRATLEAYTLEGPPGSYLTGQGTITLYAVVPDSFRAENDAATNDPLAEDDEYEPLVPEDWFFYGSDSWNTSEELDGPVFRDCIGQVNFEAVAVF